MELHDKAGNVKFKLSQFLTEILENETNAADIRSYVENKVNGNLDMLVDIMKTTGARANFGLLFSVKENGSRDGNPYTEKEYCISSYLEHIIYAEYADGVILKESFVSSVKLIIQETDVERKITGLRILYPEVQFYKKYWNLITLSNILQGEYKKLIQKDLSKDDKQPEPDKKQNEIQNIWKIHDNAKEQTETINSYYWKNVDKGFESLQGVFVLSQTLKMYWIALQKGWFDKNLNMEAEINKYVDGFKSGYNEFLNEINVYTPKCNNTVISAIKGFPYGKSKIPYTYRNGKIVPEKWDELGRNIGYYYCAWCEVLKNQSYFEPLFLDAFPEPQTKELPKEKKTKEPLTFLGLFKHEYAVEIDRLIGALKRNGYIDDNNVWRETTNGNEPAKVYKYIEERGALKSGIKLTPGLKCFCKKFGIIAYTDKEPRPAPGQRAVTVKNLIQTGIGPDDRKTFNTVFSPFLIKK
jgi:hypothetical protein